MPVATEVVAVAHGRGQVHLEDLGDVLQRGAPSVGALDVVEPEDALSRRGPCTCIVVRHRIHGVAEGVAQRQGFTRVAEVPLGHLENLSPCSSVVGGAGFRHHDQHKLAGGNARAFREGQTELVQTASCVVEFIAREVSRQITDVQQFHKLVIEVVSLVVARVVGDLVDDDVGQGVVTRGVVLQGGIGVVVQRRWVRATRDHARAIVKCCVGVVVVGRLVGATAHVRTRTVVLGREGVVVGERRVGATDAHHVA